MLRTASGKKASLVALAREHEYQEWLDMRCGDRCDDRCDGGITSTALAASFVGFDSLMITRAFMIACIVKAAVYVQIS